MKSFFSIVLVGFMIFTLFPVKVNASEKESTLNNTKKVITNIYADKYCSAKGDHFFEGLDNEKMLKYSYFRYIGLNSKNLIQKDIYNTLINQIRERCLISKREEQELYEFFLVESKSKEN